MALTAMLPRPVFLTLAELSFPANRAAPIAAELVFSDPDGARIEAAFDWRHTGTQSWDIEVEAQGASLVLSEGGRKMSQDERLRLDAPRAEHDAILPPVHGAGRRRRLRRGPGAAGPRGGRLHARAQAGRGGIHRPLGAPPL